MVQISLFCTYCSVEFKREKKAYNSSKKKGGENYKPFCSSKCGGLFASTNSISMRAVDAINRVCTKCLREGCQFHIGATWCKDCVGRYQKKYREEHPLSAQQKEKQSLRQKEWRNVNKKRIAAVSACYYENNKDRLKLIRASYYKRNKIKCRSVADKYYRANRAKILTSQRKFKLLNKEKVRITKNRSEQKRLRNNPFLKLRKRVSAQIRLYLTKNGYNKDGNSILKFLPYSIKKLKQYLEGKFEPWMNWNNYGPYDSKSWDEEEASTWKWNIDHIVPQSKLPYTSMEEENFKKCWALENLRPYSAKQNCLDGVNGIR